MGKLAKIISVLFHPIIMPFIGSAIIVNSGMFLIMLSSHQKNILYTQILLLSLVLPLSIISPLVFFRKITDLSLNERRRRVLPMFITVICFYISYRIIPASTSFYIVKSFLLAATLNVMTLMFVSFFWKISLHMAGIGGLIALTIFLDFTFHINLFYLILSQLLLSGIIAAARLYSNAHKPSEIVVGFLVGFAVTYGVLLQVISW